MEPVPRRSPNNAMESRSSRSALKVLLICLAVVVGVLSALVLMLWDDIDVDRGLAYLGLTRGNISQSPQTPDPDLAQALAIDSTSEADQDVDELAEQRAMEEEQERIEQERIEQERIELERLEQERVQAELLAFETSYYNESIAEKVIASEWSVSPQTLSQGEVMLVRHSEEQEVSFGDQTYPLQPFGTGFYAFIPVSVNLSPGEYQIGDQWITVESHQFKTQYLEVNEQLESMRRDTERIIADQEKVSEARSVSEPQFLFSPDQPFLQPIEGRLTTPFGYTRYVNGELSGRHMAIDLAMPQGTPIEATNDGIVVMAEELYLAGNSIYVDHGMNLFSQYSHLYEMYVEAGDEVKRGDIIGTVGSTGFSTGPHLHFTFSVNNIPVDPALFFDQTPFEWFE